MSATNQERAEHTAQVVSEVPQLLLRMDQVAKMLGISRSYAYELVSEGKIPGVVRLHAKGSIRVSERHLRAWIDGLVE